MPHHQDDRRRPHVSIPPNTLPPGTQHLVTPSSANLLSPHSLQTTLPVYGDVVPIANRWEDQAYSLSSVSSKPRAHSNIDFSAHSLSRSTSAYVPGRNYLAFPEPQIYRSSSQGATPDPYTTEHRQSRTDLGLPHSPIRLHEDPSTVSFASMASSFNESDYHGSGSGGSQYGDSVESLSRELSNLSFSAEELLRLFQAGELPQNDEDWYRLVPPEAREALGKQEVQRQSVMFELIKAERDYVSDLEAIEEVYVEGLRGANPPIIRESLLSGFIDDVFGNLRQILTHHQGMLTALFARQREQHPLIQSVADVVLDATIKSDFRAAYDIYIKHYPLAESHHRKELKYNPVYQSFLQSVSTDPRIRKRDLITFLSRPVTRLPRLNLLLEQILKLTDKAYEHPDLQTLPLILGILRDCIKSTQPGIEAAESKVKFRELYQSLCFRHKEIIDTGLYEESRTLVYSSPVSRRARTDSGFSGWTELTASLLDNYFLLTRDEKQGNGSVKRYVTSRPLPLSYLRVASFTSPAETRRVRTEDGGLLDSLISPTMLIYPFTICHAASASTRRYTLYVSSEALRKKWQTALVNAIGLHKVRQEANMWFEMTPLTDASFRTYGPKMTGRILTATPFTSGDRRFLAVGCSSGIYVSHRGEEKFRRVLNHSSPTSLVAIHTFGGKVFNKLVVHFETSLLSYSLDILARVALDKAPPETLDASLERVVGHDTNVVFFKYMHIKQRALLVYASKRLFQLTLHAMEVVDTTDIVLSPRRTHESTIHSFRPFGEPGFIPRDAFDITPLIKTIGICATDRIVILDPTNLANSPPMIIPDLQEATTRNVDMSILKQWIENAKPLGLVLCDSELLVIYDLIGCYITKQGKPTRKCEYIRWEAPVARFARRGNHLLLFSPLFIEIRNITTGHIVQVIGGNDIRLLYSGTAINDSEPILVAMRGSKNDDDGISDKIVELTETLEISAANTPTTAAPAVSALWDEWDM